LLYRIHVLIRIAPCSQQVIIWVISCRKFYPSINSIHKFLLKDTQPQRHYLVIQSRLGEVEECVLLTKSVQHSPVVDAWQRHLLAEFASNMNHLTGIMTQACLCGQANCCNNDANAQAHYLLCTILHNK